MFEIKTNFLQSLISIFTVESYIMFVKFETHKMIFIGSLRFTQYLVH